MSKKEKILYWAYEVVTLIGLGIKKLLKIALFIIIFITAFLFDLAKDNK